ncbi:MAG: putative terminase small subunit [Prokaryotic dsDNA virus sp.]|nr:MAG: putative terminase small subunit [Prokaryotic dsDNA virus sp.]|tara:strand:+ start:13284 stop:13700 length:417 start_codon:yes stop_codon:yes gene_type:complete
MAKLSAKQELFWREYLVDLNATQAAVRAGYSVKTARVIGSENLLKPAIALLIQQAMAERSESTGITACYVLEGIKSLTDTLVAGEDPKSAYKGFELLGKHLALFSDKVDHTSSDGSMSPDKLSDEDLDEKIKGLLGEA